MDAEAAAAAVTIGVAVEDSIITSRAGRQVRSNGRKSNPCLRPSTATASSRRKDDG